MSVTVTEKPDSRPSSTGQEASVDLHYTIRGTADDVAAKAALLSAAPAEYDGLVRQTARIEPVHIDAANGAACVWDGTVRYGRYAGSSPNASRRASSTRRSFANASPSSGIRSGCSAMTFSSGRPSPAWRRRRHSSMTRRNCFRRPREPSGFDAGDLPVTPASLLVLRGSWDTPPPRPPTPLPRPVRGQNRTRLVAALPDGPPSSDLPGPRAEPLLGLRSLRRQRRLTLTR